MAVLRWENARLRLFQDGIDVGTLFCTDFMTDDEFTDDKSKYQGSEIPDGDSSYNGGSGSFTLERRSGSVNIEQMLDRYRDGVKRRDGTGRLSIQASDVHEDGIQVVYRFSNCRFSASRKGTQNQRLTTSIRFQFDNQERVA